MTRTGAIAVALSFVALAVAAPAAAQSDEDEWVEGGDDAGWEEEEEEVEEEEQAPPPSAPPEEEEAEEEAEEGEHEDTAIGRDDEAVEGQEGGLGVARAPVLYGPAPAPTGDDDFSLVIPPLLYERAGGVETIATFPLFYLRQSRQTTELTIPPYYLMRGPEEWDVLFPLFWFYRGAGHHTFVLPPFWHHDATDGHDFGIFPLVMTGRHETRHYTLIPPLLTLDWGTDGESRYTFSSLFWRVWENQTEHWGIFPFLWVENGERNSYTIVPPLFFRFEDRTERTALTVVPPFYHRDEPNGSYFGIPPLFHHNSGPNHTSTTIFPLLSHYSEEPDVQRLTVAGLFWWWRDHGDETIVTPLYQRFRGATELDAIAPFFFYIRDPRTDSTTLAVPPLVWHIEDPASSATVVAPFFARFEERGRSTTWLTPLFGNHENHETGDETTWVLPTLQVSRWHDGDAVNIHPIFYYESVPSHRHSVLAPFWWDLESFEGDRNRYTVLFPFFWRFREGNTTSTLVLNAYHRERTRADGSSEWEFHLFPFFSYGENSEGGHWWKMFYGLAGYERRGQYGVTTLFYVPFQTDGPPLPSDGRN
ncbi:MAG: hypothetical protein KF729_19910 [Sandaracinaceae bacterium]|nr:hypothetical protein [Sandaracinaceae bacterium]